MIIITIILIVLIIPFILGIILLVKALKQKGHFLINNDDWKFEFKRREDMRIIEEIIQNIYYLQSL